MEKISDELRRKVILTNFIALVLFCVSFPYIPLFYKLGYPALSYPLIPMDIIFLSCIALNYLGLFTASRLICLITGNIAAFSYSMLLGPEAGAQNLFFAFIGASLVIFLNTERWKQIVSLLLPVILYIILLVTNFELIKPVFGQEYVHQILFSAVLASFIILISELTFLMIITNQYETSILNEKEKQVVIIKNLETEQEAHQNTIVKLKEKDHFTQELLSQNKILLKKLEMDMEHQKRVYEELQLQTTEKIAALQKADKERAEKEAAIQREQEKAVTIQEQLQTIESNQEALAEKAKHDKLLRVGQSIQQHYLQTTFRENHVYKLSTYHRASDGISGDYYTVKEWDDGCISFFVLDVTGHGAPAAIIASSASIVTEDLLNDLSFYQGPAEVLTCLNQKMFTKKQISKAVACTYCMFDPKTRLLRYARGGSEALLVIRNGDVIRLSDGDGPVLRMFEVENFIEADYLLEKGDILIVATDGINDLELKNGKPFIPTIEKKNKPLFYDYSALKKIVANLPKADGNWDAKELGNAVVEVCLKPKDDITIVCVEIFNS